MESARRMILLSWTLRLLWTRRSKLTPRLGRAGIATITTGMDNGRTVALSRDGVVGARDHCSRASGDIMSWRRLIT
jgi:hypothetical protein